MTKPTHAIIVPHYNDVDRLTRCLTALVPQLNDEVEVIVADNSSTDDLSAVQGDFPMVRFVVEPAKGASMARNRGVAETEAAGLIFLDADCVPDAGWLAHACAIDASDALVGGRINVFHETPAPKSGTEVFEEVFAFKQDRYIAKDGFSVTANLVTTRAVFEKTGPFHTGVSEDVDWCRRAVAAGFALRYDDDLSVGHPSRQDWPALEKKWKRLTYEMFGLTGKTAKGRIKWAVRGLAMVPAGLVHSRNVATHPGLSSSERLSGISTLLKLRWKRCVWMLGQAITGR